MPRARRANELRPAAPLYVMVVAPVLTAAPALLLSGGAAAALVLPIVVLLGGVGAGCLGLPALSWAEHSSFPADRVTRCTWAGGIAGAAHVLIAAAVPGDGALGVLHGVLGTWHTRALIVSAGGIGLVFALAPIAAGAICGRLYARASAIAPSTTLDEPSV